MDISRASQNFSEAIKEVDQNGMAVINKYNKPTYVLMTFEFYQTINAYFKNLNAPINQVESEVVSMDNMNTLHEAMRIVLESQPNKTMRYNELANTIWERKLYCKRDGKKASSSQIMLRARNYKELFEICGDGGHYIALK